MVRVCRKLHKPRQHKVTLASIVKVSIVNAADRSSVKALLVSAAIPIDEIAEHFECHRSGRWRGDRGCYGLDRNDGSALLRSLVGAAWNRPTGLQQQLFVT